MTLNISLVVSVVCLVLAFYLYISREFTKFDLDIVKTPSVNYRLTPKSGDIDRLLYAGKTALGWLRCSYFFSENEKYAYRVIRLAVSENRSTSPAVLFLMKQKEAVKISKYSAMSGKKIAYLTEVKEYFMETSGIRVRVTLNDIAYTGYLIDYIDLTIDFTTS